MTEQQTTDQTPSDRTDREEEEVMTGAEQAHGRGGQTANVEWT